MAANWQAASASRWASRRAYGTQLSERATDAVEGSRAGPPAGHMVRSSPKGPQMQSKDLALGLPPGIWYAALRKGHRCSRRISRWASRRAYGTQPTRHRAPPPQTPVVCASARPSHGSPRRARPPQPPADRPRTLPRRGASDRASAARSTRAARPLPKCHVLSCFRDTVVVAIRHRRAVDGAVGGLQERAAGADNRECAHSNGANAGTLQAAGDVNMITSTRRTRTTGLQRVGALHAHNRRAWPVEPPG